jgi:hypothetical protein
MHCTYPKPAGSGMRSCGGCYACRINLRREWTGRLLLESFFYPETSFVTVTYEDSHIPIRDGLEVLHRPDFDRFRREFGRTSHGPNFRWYGVGEYGDDSLRPHYHFILFGVGLGWYDELCYAWSDKIDQKDVTPKAVKEKRILRVDGKYREMRGFITCEPLVPERAAYACGYVIKKMHKPDDTRLKGRPPEFRSMSKQMGGIGVSGLGWLADMHMTSAGSKALRQRRDVFNSIRVEGKTYPIGSYLREKLREILGIPSQQKYRDHLLVEYPDDQEAVFAPPLDLADVYNLPRNRRIRDAEKIEVAPQALARIEAIARKQKRQPKGAKI